MDETNKNIGKNSTVSEATGGWRKSLAEFYAAAGVPKMSMRKKGLQILSLILDPENHLEAN